MCASTAMEIDSDSDATIQVKKSNSFSGLNSEKSEEQLRKRRNSTEVPASIKIVESSKPILKVPLKQSLNSAIGAGFRLLQRKGIKRKRPQEYSMNPGPALRKQIQGTSYNGFEFKVPKLPRSLEEVFENKSFLHDSLINGPHNDAYSMGMQGGLAPIRF